MTPFERVVGDSSKDHTVTAPTFTTRPTTEQLHHYAGRHFRAAQLTVLPLKLRKALIHVRGPPRPLAGIDRSGAHPGAQRLGMDIELGRDPPDRPMLRGRVSDRLQRHPGGPLPQLLAVLPRCCHNSSSFLESEPASDPGRNTAHDRNFVSRPMVQTMISPLASLICLVVGGLAPCSLVGLARILPSPSGRVAVPRQGQAEHAQAGLSAPPAGQVALVEATHTRPPILL